ncbi:cyclic peptide export ABC transporter [Massilia sp. CCM 8695]|uniref:Cyclic peptide export ABC transporter n=2 Tax=Massilia frigida TaxID=2609281 RepID=A0ABX0NF07_9BURK|nr:cyclic peptide export ABC transporter [Massilia frigida]NHZ80285.1 cyclic peptide export ABC transporter [Massilia frigida]
MNLIGILFKTSWRMTLIAIVASTISGFSIAGLLALINNTLARMGGAGSQLAWGFFGVCVLVLGTRVLSSTLLVRLSQTTLAGLREHLSRQILAAPLRRLEEVGKHRVLAALTDDVTIVADVFSWLPVLCMNLAVITGCLVYMGWLAWPLLLATLVLLALGIASFRFAQGRALHALTRSRQSGDELQKHFRALTDGAKELKLNQDKRDAFLARLLLPTLDDMRRHYVAGMSVLLTAESWGSLLFFVLVGLVLFVAPAIGIVDPSVLSGYALVLLYLRGPLEGMVANLPELSRSRIALGRIEALCGELRRDHEDNDGAAKVPPARFDELELRAVSHRYYHEMEERSFLLGPVNLRLQPGEIVYVVGGNGSGKTTFAKLLLGLYSPETGEILVNGVAVGPDGREGYRQLFSAVFSDFYLFDDVLGHDPAADRQAQQYLMRLQLAHKVKIEEGRFSTTALSQGQRKRLALLTAYLEDRPFYVFDEWAADQDPLFKRVFYTELLPDLRQRGKAVLVITHDDQYFHLADRCLRLDEGKLTEMGSSHETLPLTG